MILTLRWWLNLAIESFQFFCLILAEIFAPNANFEREKWRWNEEWDQGARSYIQLELVKWTWEYGQPYSCVCVECEFPVWPFWQHKNAGSHTSNMRGRIIQIRMRGRIYPTCEVANDIKNNWFNLLLFHILIKINIKI